MKKFLTLLTVMLIGIITASSAYGITRYYKCVGVYDQNGVKTSSEGKGIYITIINNNNIAYESDANGNFPGGYTYKLRGIRDGKAVYQSFSDTGFGIMWVGFYYYFTPDFKRLNEVLPWGETRAYEVSTPEDEVRSPGVFY